MRLLVITRAPWNNDNGIGSTFTDFFSEFTSGEIYSLCMREAPFVSNITKENFYISEQQFVNYILRKGEVGKITQNSTLSKDLDNEKKLYKNGKRINSILLTFAREALWSFNLWKNQNLDEYLNKVKPDVVFFPDFPCLYAHKVFEYIIHVTKAKAIIYHADDCYTLRQFSLSPLFWINRFALRKWVRNSVKLCQIYYTISEVQKEDYDTSFGVKHKLLTKYGDFNSNFTPKQNNNSPLTLVYTGSLEMNRWRSLAIIADGLRRVNKQESRAVLYVYSGTSISQKMKEALDIPGTSILMGSVKPDKIEAIQKGADILVHVESFDLKNRLVVRQSFSTKIVDYFKRGRAILAVGPRDVASIRYLIDNDCVIYASNAEEVEKQILRVLDGTSQLNEFAKKAYLCGKTKHNKDKMQKMLYDDIVGLANIGCE